VPLDEFSMLDALNHLDANSIKQRDGISWNDIEKSGDNTATVCANLDNAVLVTNFTHAFDGCLQHFAMGFNKIELTLFFTTCSAL
jgi:hypothetical protein